MTAIYPPLEDSHLLAGIVAARANGRVLDMGCGSGIQAMAALENKAVTSVLGVDVNPAAVRHCRRFIVSKKARFLVSDLFVKVPAQRFDTIIFNPPYLPADEFPQDKAVIGGRHGWETIARFLDDAPDFLADSGQILLLFTSRTGKRDVDRIIAEHLLDAESLLEKTIAFETYYVYILTLSDAYKDCRNHNVTRLRYLAKGHRGFVHRAVLKRGRKNQQVVIKSVNPASKATGRINIEAQMLQRVNKKGIGPKFIFSTQNVLCMEFVPGKPIGKWLSTAKKSAVVKVLRAVLKQCRTLDSMGVQKEEMHHPVKHVIVGPRNMKATLIDFERARMTPKPHNVNQFMQYMRIHAPELVAKHVLCAR
jgi:HemK-related putative methylase